VVDLGSNTVKAGYAGEDTPKAVFPSAVAGVGTFHSRVIVVRQNTTPFNR
jgi:actin-related protein